MLKLERATMSTNAKPDARRSTIASDAPENTASTDTASTQEPTTNQTRTNQARHKKSRREEERPRSEEERLRMARERARDYREGRTAEWIDATEDASADEDLPETLDEWMDLVSRRVEEGMRRGMFDNLPGRGKPQSLQRDPYVPEDMQMAYNLMKKNQITPGWIGDRKAVLGAIDVLRDEMRTIGTAFRARSEQISVEADVALLVHEWHSCVQNWEERIVRLNEQILNLNLTQPSLHLEVYKLRLDEELKRAGVTRALLH